MVEETEASAKRQEIIDLLDSLIANENLKIIKLEREIAELKEGRISRFRLPKGYLDEDYDD